MNEAEKAFLEGLVGEHLGLVYSAAVRQVGDAALAEDVTQGVFLIAVKKAGKLPRERAAAWLVKVTRYVALSALREDRRRRKREMASARRDMRVIETGVIGADELV